jgi:FAD:protein FMN transferase
MPPATRALSRGSPSGVTQARRRAMGSDAHLVVVTEGDGDALVARAWARIDELESRWSRFRADSEVSTLNRCAGQTVTVSDDTIALVHHALAAWRLTGGRFDPTVAAALIAHGYDRDLAEVVARGGTAPEHAAPAPGPTGIALDREAHTVMLPAGVTFDPGGIGKGLGADLVAAELLAAGAAGALVNLGGDVRAVGTAPADTGWVISVPDPLRSRRELARIALPDGGIATTSRLRRRWSTPRGTAHHLIDPATGRPAVTDAVAATVVAATAWRAEALTKLAFLAGPNAVRGRGDAHAVVVTRDGRRYTTPGLAGAVR